MTRQKFLDKYSHYDPELASDLHDLINWEQIKAYRQGADKILAIIESDIQNKEVGW